MPIIQVILVLIVIGVLLWLLETQLAQFMDARIVKIIEILVVIWVVLWILSLFIDFGSLGTIGTTHRIGK